MSVFNNIDISRIFLLSKIEFFRSRKSIMMTLVVIFGIFLIGHVLEQIFGDVKVYDEHEECFAFSLIVGGLILSSLAFRDLGHNLGRNNYLMIPASSLEKFISMWLLSSIGWVMLYSIAFIIYAFIMNALGSLIFSHVSYQDFQPLSDIAIRAVKVYLIVQSVMLVGAVHFRGYVFLKTLFTLIVFTAICATVIVLSLKSVFLTDHDCSGECELFNFVKLHTALNIMEGMFWYVLAPLSWVIAYLGLKDQEV